MQILNGVTSLSKEFDVFLVDLWGVVWDGHTVYPGAIDALACLRQQAKVCFISNTPLNAQDLATLLHQHGIAPTQYDDLLSSGGVMSFGKPHAPIYEMALARMGQPDRSTVCAIGDSLLTDIKGANSQAFYSVWVLPQYATPLNPAMIQSLQEICDQQHVMPDALLPHFMP